jgi:hypothetical protein
MSECRGVARNRSALDLGAEECCETEKSKQGADGEHRRAHRYHATVAILAIVFIASGARAASAGDAFEEKRDSHKIAYSFVFMGCNRLLKGDKTPDNPSTANLPQLLRSFTEIAALRPPPRMSVPTSIDCPSSTREQSTKSSISSSPTTRCAIDCSNRFDAPV